MPKRVIYKRPPVVERAVSVVGRIEPELFEKRMPAWQSLVRSEFPIYEPFTEWKLDIKQQAAGPPVMNPDDAEVQVIHRFWKQNDAGRKVWCLQLRADQLTVNLLRTGEDGHRFEDMAAVLATWLPKWVDHFTVKDLHGTRIEYVNVISSTVTPHFVDKTGAIEIGKAFVVFSGLPIPHAGLTPPFDCQMTVISDPKIPCSLTLRVFGSEYGQAPAIQIRFLAVTSADKKSLTVPQLSEEIAFAHSKIIEAFEYLFTAEAKQSFGPS